MEFDGENISCIIIKKWKKDFKKELGEIGK
jgi:hypothetical protein